MCAAFALIAMFGFLLVFFHPSRTLHILLHVTHHHFEYCHTFAIYAFMRVLLPVDRESPWPSGESEPFEAVLWIPRGKPRSLHSLLVCLLAAGVSGLVLLLLWFLDKRMSIPS